MSNLLNSYYKLIKRLIPAKSEGCSVGLDIGAGECKAVALSKAGKGFQLVNWAIEPITNGDISAAIQKTLNELDVPCKSVYSSVFGKGTLIRYIDMPLMSLDDLRNSFAIEADKYFPFPQDQIYTDCYILDDHGGKDKQMAVIAAAAKREMVDQRIDLLNALGYSINFIGVNPIALANVFNVLGLGEDEKKDSAIAVLDMGESVSNLTIVVNRLPRFTRDIFIGGRDFTKRISNSLGVSFQEAEQLKRNPGEKMVDVTNAWEAVSMNVLHEIRLSFDYFSNERNIEIGQLFLTGGASMLDGIIEIFEKNLEIKVGKWNPLGSLKIASGLSSDEVKRKSLKLGVALGLALYEYD